MGAGPKTGQGKELMLRIGPSSAGVHERPGQDLKRLRILTGGTPDECQARALDGRCGGTCWWPALFGGLCHSAARLCYLKTKHGPDDSIWTV